MVRDTEVVIADKKAGRGGGKDGKQYDLSLNFGEFEFDFGDSTECLDEGNEHNICSNQGGAVTVRIFGKEQNQPPILEMRWTFDQLSGKAPLPGMSATYPNDFLTQYRHQNNLQIEHVGDATNGKWVCVPYRGIPSMAHVYLSNFVMLLVFCILSFMPHMSVVASIIFLCRGYISRRGSRSSYGHSNKK